MRLTRVYSAARLHSGERCVISGSAVNHLTRVLRLGVGSAVTLFDGTGGEYAARIESLAKGALHFAVGAHDATERESPLAVTLAQGVARGERMDWVIQKATELGVRSVVPLITERTVVRLDERQADKKSQHWRGIMISACEQCGRNRLPDLAAPVALREFLARPSLEGELRLLLSPAGALRIPTVTPRSKITLLIGPEGGLTAEERSAAVAREFLQVRLGPRILRTETAAIAALAALQQSFGDL